MVLKERKYVLLTLGGCGCLAKKVEKGQITWKGVNFGMALPTIV